MQIENKGVAGDNRGGEGGNLNFVNYYAVFTAGRLHLSDGCSPS